jgi:hypothetical protein
VSVDIGNGDTVGVHEVFDMDERRVVADSEKRQQKNKEIAQYLLDIVCVAEIGLSKQTTVIELLVKEGTAKLSAWKTRVNEALPLTVPQYAMDMSGLNYRLTRAKRSGGSSITIDKELLG